MNYEESIEWLNTIPLSFDRENKNYEFKKNTKSEKLTEEKGFIDKILKKIR